MSEAATSSEDADDAPWYANGLAFACTGCGNCCSGSGYVWVDDDEVAALAEFQGRPPGEVRLLDTRPVQGKVTLREHKNGECIYLDGLTKRCSVYEARPRQCRAWPFWRRNLSEEQSWGRARATCPGIDRGQIVPLEEIEAAAAEAGI